VSDRLPNHFNSRAIDPTAAQRSVKLHDITLREGQQAADVAFDLDEKVELAARLAETGVLYAQAGFAGADEDVVAAIKGAGIDMRLCLLLVAFKDDWPNALARAVESGADVIQVLVRSGDAQLRTMGLSRADAQRLTEDAVAASFATGLATWYIPSFGTHADEEFLLRLYRAAADAGASATFIADTLGVVTPEAVAYLVAAVKKATGGRTVGVHCHNDFGLAIANTLAGVLAGAELAEVSVNGYGERAGNCSTAEFALALELLYGIESGLRLERLTDLERFASEIAGIPLPTDKPISGSNVFAQKLDIHVALTKEDAGLMEPYSPDLVGNRRVLRLGTGSGPVAVRAKLAELGVSPPDDDDAVLELARRVRVSAVSKKASVEDNEFLELAEGLLGRPFTAGNEAN
jgi:isopropylmalate/homocitrate/citramalate synthase